MPPPCLTAARAILRRALDPSRHLIAAVLSAAVLMCAPLSAQSPAEFQALFDQADEQVKQKQYEEARHTLTRIREQAISASNPLAYAMVSGRLGIVAWYLGDDAALRRHHRDAADNYGAMGMRVEQANALRNLTFARDMSMAERATVVAAAWDIVRDLDEPVVKGLILHQWGDVLSTLGDYARGIEKLEAADALLRTAGDPRYAALLTSMGRIYRLHGRADKAIEVYERILPMQERSGDRRGVAQTLDALAIAQLAAGDQDGALLSNQRAIDAARRAGASDLVANIEVSSAGIDLRLGRYAIAIERIERQLADPAMPATLVGYAHRTLAESYLGLGRVDEAMAAAERAVTAMDKTGNQEGRTLVAVMRASVRRRTGDLKGAIADNDRAIEIVEQLRASAVPRDGMKQSFTDPFSGVFAQAIELRADTGDWAGSLAITERARARAFLDLLATRATAAGAPATSPGDRSSHVVVPPAALDEIRAIARRIGSTIVAYWVAPDGVYVWVVSTAGAINGRRLDVKPDRIESLARQVWGSFEGTTSTAPDRMPSITTRGGTRRDVSRDVREPLRELYRLLLAPIASLLPAAQGSLLTIVPHGPIFGVPFTALIDPRGSYLIEQYRLHEVPSVAVLNATTLRTAPNAPAKRARSVLLIADPSPMPASPFGTALSTLPGARQEVQAIARLLSPGLVTTLIGAEATEANLRGQSGRRAAVHLATHGVFADDRPFESFLAFARGGAEPERDGRLEASEVYDLSIDAELVVLSGCRTATGQVNGDGIIGLSRAFFTAGTQSVIATRWDIADEAARWLMPEFYRRWLRGASASAALREAQIAFIAALRKGAVTVTTPFGEIALPEHPALWAAPALLGQP